MLNIFEQKINQEAHYHQLCRNNESGRNDAFTLAEVLITIGVLGVITAITIPQLMKNMTDHAFSKAKENSLMKITEATKMMKSNDVLSGYTSNDEFVNTFQKYMKVSNRCDSSNLAKCFPAKIKTGTGDLIDTTTLTAGTNLGSNNLSNNTIAFMLSNGTSVLFTLRDSTKTGTACARIKPYDNKSDTTGCLSFLYDINGYGAPNVMGRDIGSVNATISTCSGVKAGSLCVDSSDIAYNAYPAVGTFIHPVYGVLPNRWEGAKKACTDKGMRLPTKDELNTLYINRATIGGFNTSGGNPSVYWSATESDSVNSWNQYFGNGSWYSSDKSWDLAVRCIK